VLYIELQSINRFLSVFRFINVVITSMESSNLILFIVFSLLVVVIIKSYRTLSKIKASRQMGANLSKRNWYYKFLSKYFIKNLPS